jgi:DNA processing protein
MLVEAFVDLLSVLKMNEARLKNLLVMFGTPEKVFSADIGELVTVPGIDEELAQRIKSYRRDAETEKRIALAKEVGIETVSYQDQHYPKNLKEVPHSPPVLFIRGEIKKEDECALAIIGTRKATHQGKMAAEKFGRELAEQGITVVSGLARGVDTAAHRGAVGAGRTIAVLGCGIDVSYPPENKGLLEEIVKHGAVVSEFNLGTPPVALNFPKRNRIISGLSLAVIAVEAGKSSGVLSTVNWALDQGREVFALPGSVMSLASEGTNQLIKDGAKPVTSIDDVLEEMKLTKRILKPEIALHLTEDEIHLVGLLSEKPLNVDQIMELMGRPISEVLTKLLELEMKGAIRQLPGKVYIKNI